MSEEILIPGLMLAPVNIGTAKRPRTEFFFLIKLDELTTAVVEGRPALGPSDTSGTQEFWTDEEIAQLILNLSPSAAAEMDEDEMRRLASNTLDILGSQRDEQDTLNQQAWKFARSSEPPGWHSFLVNPEGGQELGPTILYVSANQVRHRALKKRYRSLVAQRKYKAFYEDVHYFARLAEFERKKLGPLRRRQDELDESLAVVRHVTARVSNAHMGVLAMFHCAESKGERRKLWNSKPPIEEGDHVFGDQLVPRVPSAVERDGATRVRDTYLPRMFKNLSELTAWMASGMSKDGKNFADATLRNHRAQDLLDALRENEDILTLLENHLHVDRILWRRVEGLLLECFHHLLLAPNTREDLLGGELAQLALHVARPVPPLELLSEKTKRAREIKAAMERFVLDVALDGETTRLSQAFLQLKSHADPLLDHRSTLTKLWSLATPTLMDHIQRAAEKAGDPNPSAVAASWGWRSAFGVIELDEETQKDVWERAVLFTENPSKSNAKNIFAAEGLRVENRFWNSDAAWSAYETTIAIIAATDAVMAHADNPSTDTAIEAWTAALGAVKAVPDLAATLKETQAFVRMTTGPGKSLLSKIANFGDSVPLKFVDGILALLKFEATARATKAVLKSKTASGNDKDIAREKQTLAYVGMLVSAAGTLLGSPLVLAGTVLYLGGAVLLNRKVWNACLSEIEGLPGPGRGVKLVWMEIVEGAGGGQSLATLVKGTPWEASIMDDVENLKGHTSDVSEVGWGNFWPISSGNFIDSPLVAGMLRRQYGVPLEFAKELAAY